MNETKFENRGTTSLPYSLNAEMDDKLREVFPLWQHFLDECDKRNIPVKLFADAKEQLQLYYNDDYDCILVDKEVTRE